MRYERFKEHKDYMAIAEAAADPSTPPTEVTQEDYWDALNCLPPIYVAGGFLICEEVTHCVAGPVHAMYAHRQGKYYAKYVVWGKPQTYIAALYDAYPLEEKIDG